jgi:hypothetical protein
LADGNAPFVSSSEMVSLPSWPNAWIRPVLVTVAVPPWMGTAPALMRMLPVASRLVVIVLSRLSPVVVSAPLPGLKVLETARSQSFQNWPSARMRLSREQDLSGATARWWRRRRKLRDKLAAVLGLAGNFPEDFVEIP